MQRPWSTMGLMLGLYLVASSAQATENRPLVFSHVSVIDATGRPPQQDMTVVIAEGRISAVGRGSEVNIPKDAQVVEAGLSPLEALQTATRNPAAFLGQSNLVGTLETGKAADLVLLEANPLEDARNLRAIAGVVVGGRFLTKSALQEMVARGSAASPPAR